MNGYSQLLRYIKQIGRPLVNTITQGDFDSIDISKKDIFPLLHVAIGNASFPSEGVVRFSVQIGCFDIRDTNKEVNADKYYDNDNEVDNLNATLAVLNRIWLLMLRDFEELNISAGHNPSLEICTEYAQNLLDGWIMSFEVETPNDTISLCP